MVRQPTLPVTPLSIHSTIAKMNFVAVFGVVALLCVAGAIAGSLSLSLPQLTIISTCQNSDFSNETAKRWRTLQTGTMSRVLHPEPMPEVHSLPGLLWPGPTVRQVCAAVHGVQSRVRGVSDGVCHGITLCTVRKTMQRRAEV